MSSYASAALTETPPRSATLRTTVAAAVLGAVGAVGWGVLLLTVGKSLIRGSISDYAQQILGDAVSSGTVSVDDLVDLAYQPFQSRAAAWLVLGVLGALCVFLLTRGMAWVRIVLTLVALGAIGLAIVDLSDISPGVLKALDGVAAIGFAVALVTQWLPGTSAALRARRNR